MAERSTGGDTRGSGIGDRRLYLCTPDRPDLEDFLRACIRGGVDVVQLRDKQLDARPLLQRAEVALGVCRELGVPFVFNDRPDLALAVGADGVHVGQDDAPPELARRILGGDAIVGLSTHAPAELDAAVALSQRTKLDYVSTGPVAPTPTKAGRPGTGLDYLTYAARVLPASLPSFVTGGVTPDTIGPMLDAGARRFVVVRWLTGADDPEANARKLRDAIDAVPFAIDRETRSES